MLRSIDYSAPREFEERFPFTILSIEIMKALVFGSFLLSVFFFNVSIGVANEVPPTVGDIIGGIKASENNFFQLDSFLVNCGRKKSENITPSRYGGGYINVAFIVAKSGDQWFTSKAFTEVGQKGPSGDNTVRGVWTPLEPEISVLKKDILLEWVQYGERASVDRFADSHNVHQCFDYFRHIGWNVSRRIVETDGGNYDAVLKIPALNDYLDHPFLPEFLEKNKSRYVVHPDREDVDGFLCWVVEYPGMDRLWIDVDHGYAVRKRIYHWGPGKPRKFAVLNQDWKEVTPGLWLPHKQIVDKYASIVSEDSKIWDQVTARMHYEVEEILIDNVPDSLFEVSLPVGTRVIDLVRGTQYTIYDPSTDPFAGPIELASRANRFVIFRAITIIIGSILIIVAVWRMLSRMEKK